MAFALKGDCSKEDVEVFDKAFKGSRPLLIASEGKKKELLVALFGNYREPAFWGIVLADILRHAANWYEEQNRMPREQAVMEIWNMFAAEMKNPTAEAKTLEIVGGKKKPRRSTARKKARVKKEES